MPENGYQLTKLLYSIPEVGEQLGIAQSTIYTLIRERKLKAVRVGRRTMVKAPDLTAFLDALNSHQ
jgi:excisionase family DNA binding protein